MAKRQPSKEIITLIGPGTPTKQSKTSNYQEQPDAGQHDDQGFFNDSGFSERDSQENGRPMQLGGSNTNVSSLTHCRDEDFSGDSDHQHEENLPEELRVIRVDEDSNEASIVEASSITGVNQRHFAENVQYCPIAIGPDAAKQQKKEKKRRKNEGFNSEDEESTEERILKQSCALLNSGGGLLVMKITDFQSSTTKANALDNFWKTIEPKLMSLVKPSRYDDIFDRREQSDEILLFINAPPHICTIKYNLSLPGDSRVLEASYHETVDLLIKETQQGRKRKHPNVTVPLTKLPEVPEVFTHKEIILNLKESKQIQFKHFTSKTFLDSKNRSQREDITKQVSAFANADGGVILLGVKDDGEVCGLDLGENGKDCIERNLQKNVIEKMHWSLDPVRNTHWNLKFFPVSGREANAIVAIYVAGMRRSGGVFSKNPKSFKLLQGKDGQQSLHRLDFEEWKQRMLSREGLQSNSRAAQDLLSKFQTMHISKGHLLTVKQEVQRIKDAFFVGGAGFPVFPEGFETTLSPEVQSVIHKIQKKCSGYRNRGLLVASRSWMGNTGGTPMEGVICDLLVISRNMGGLHLLTLCHSDADDRFLNYSREAARSIKVSLVKDGACREKFYISPHVVSCMEESDIKLESCDGRYPKGYNLESSREKLNEVLKSMVIILASVPSTLSNKLGVSIMNLLTKEQFKLVHQQIEVNRELWIKGVAGTGKTLVAVEFMRELHRREKLRKSEILCVCENEGIANQIRESDVCNVVCRQTFMWVQFPDVKHVVMDEVHNYEQPIGTESWHQKARKLVRQHDPAKPGYLWFFIDRCQSNHTFPAGLPPESEQKPQFTLTKVIRNSHKIFSHSKDYVPDNDVKNSLEMGHDFEGEDVKVICYSRSAISQIDVVYKTLDRLLNEGYRKGDIAVLFKKEACIPRQLSFHFESATENDSESIVVSTVLKYSGLERPVVVLVDIDNGIIRGRKKTLLIYGAVTRGMVKLVIIRCES